MRRMLVAAAFAATAITGPSLASAAPDVQATPSAFPGADGKIVFAGYPRASSLHTEIYAMNPDGSGLRRLTNNHVDDAAPDLSANGKRIVFARLRPTSGLPRSDLFVMNRWGHHLHRLTHDPAYEESPSWSPDGSRVAFVRHPYSGGINIWVIDVATGALTLMTPTGAPDSEPEWSPDGGQIVFAQGEKEGSAIKAVTVVASPFGPGAITTLVLPRADNAAPDWSPDGTAIVFSRHDATDPRDDLYLKYVAGPDAGTVRRLTRSRHADDTTPAFSPDGHHVVWARGHETGQPTAELWVRRLGSVSDAHRITTDPDLVDRSPDWGPAPAP